MCEFTVVIPTLQKNIDILKKLIAELVEDESIGKVILIDNSLKGFEYKSDKLEVICPEKNLFVNPSWNLGIQHTQTKYLAIFNDDILIPKNLCRQVLDKIKSDDNIGLIGLDSSSIKGTDIEDMKDYPSDVPLYFDVINTSYMTGYWGAAIFGRKENFYTIPEKMKIWCGDNFLIFQNIKNNKANYQIRGANIKHLGSMSISIRNRRIVKILRDDVCRYAKIDENYKKHPLYMTFFEKCFSIQHLTDTCYNEIFILGFVIRYKDTYIEMPFHRRIFSVRNEDEHKVITLCGLRFKFKQKTRLK